MMSSQTVQAWIFAVVSMSKPARATSASPECGPLPVTTVPRMTANQASPKTAIAIRRWLEVASTTGLSLARRSSTTARQSSATLTSRWSATMYQVSPASTVMPPITPWMGMPSAISVASSLTLGSRAARLRCSQAVSKVVMAMTMRTKVSRRLPNSMMPCSPISGVETKDSVVQRGQVGQPNPDPVSRTTAPVTTRSELPTMEAQATPTRVLREPKKRPNTCTTGVRPIRVRTSI